ncbi:hypothetical protein M9458_000195, partial [Cirrhinus mrigala]
TRVTPGKVSRATRARHVLRVQAAEIRIARSVCSGQSGARARCGRRWDGSVGAAVSGSGSVMRRCVTLLLIVLTA